ncbi:MAG: hypothetical protein ACKVHR_15630 [Pirellulales bacterium]
MIESTTALFHKWWTPSVDVLHQHQQEMEFSTLRETQLENRILLSANPMIAMGDGGDVTLSAGDAADDGFDDTFRIQLAENGSQIQVIVNEQAYLLGSADDIKSIRVQGSHDNDVLMIDSDLIINSKIIFDGGGNGGDFDQIVMTQNASSVGANDSSGVADISYGVRGDEVVISVADARSAQGDVDQITLTNVESVVDLLESNNRNFTIEGGSSQLIIEQGDTSDEPLVQIRSDQSIEFNFLSPLDRFSLNTNDTFQQTIEIRDFGDGFFEVEVIAGAEDQLTFGSSNSITVDNAFLNAGSISFLGEFTSRQDLVLLAQATVNVGENASLIVGGNLLSVEANDISIHGSIVTVGQSFQVDSGDFTFGQSIDSALLPSGGIRLAASNSVEIASAGMIHSISDVLVVGPQIEHAGAIVAHGLRVELNSGDDGTTIVRGGIDVSNTSSGEIGGTVWVLGNHVGLLGHAIIDASGAIGGGVVLIGGDYQGSNLGVINASRAYVGSDVVVRVDAIANGDGGRAIVWADEMTAFFGSITAAGGANAGDGGFAEVSGKQQLAFDGWVDLSAANGVTGELLLDPQDIVIVTGLGSDDGELSDSDIFASDPGGTFEISNTAIMTALSSANVTLEAENTIIQNAGAAIDFSTTTNNLRLSTADGMIWFQSIVHAGSGGLTVIAGGDVMVSGAMTSDGSLLFNAGGEITQTVGSSIAVSGTSDFSAVDNDITLDETSNDFVGAVTATGDVIKLTDANNIELGSIDAASLEVSAEGIGEITDGFDGDLWVAGNASFSGSTIALGDEVGNETHFGSLTLNGGTVTISEDSSTEFVGSSVLTGDLTLISSGAITELEANVDVNGLLDVTGTEITLGVDSLGTFNAGTLTFNSAGSVTISEDSSLNLVGTNNADTVTLNADDDLTLAGTTTAVGQVSMTSKGLINFSPGWKITRGDVEISQLDNLEVSDQISIPNSMMAISNMLNTVEGATGEIDPFMRAEMKFDWGYNRGYGVEIDWGTFGGQPDLSGRVRVDENGIFDHQYLEYSTSGIEVKISVTADIDNKIVLRQKVGTADELTLTMRNFYVLLKRSSELAEVASVASLPEVREMPEVSDAPRVGFQPNQLIMMASAEFIEFESSVTNVVDDDARWIEIRRVDPIEGEVLWQSERARDVLDNETGLSDLLGDLPDERFRIYLVLEDGSEQKVFDVLIKNGEPTSVPVQSASEIELFSLPSQQEGSGASQDSNELNEQIQPNPRASDFKPPQIPLELEASGRK